jgi:hypothetical protein
MIMCASGTGSGGGGPKENGNVSAQVQAKLDAQLARAADEYGNAQVAFDVSYTSGTVSVGPERLDVTGTVAGAMNIALSDSNNLNSFLPGRSTTNAAGDSLVLPNAFRSDTGTIAHEYAHVFTGDTRLSIPSVLNRFGAGMMLADTIADYNNSAGRALLRNWRSPAVRALRLIDPFLEQRRQLINQRARQWFGVR